MSDSPTLTIRGQHSDDWSELYTLWSDEAVLRESLELPYMAEDAFRDQFSSSSNAYVLVAETNSLSGRKHICGAAWLGIKQGVRRRHVSQLTVMVRPDPCETEARSMLLDKALDLADNWLGLHRIEVIVFADNDSALAFYEARGFEREVAMRWYALRGGVLTDAVLLGRIRGEA